MQGHKNLHHYSKSVFKLGSEFISKVRSSDWPIHGPLKNAGLQQILENVGEAKIWTFSIFLTSLPFQTAIISISLNFSKLGIPLWSLPSAAFKIYKAR